MGQPPQTPIPQPQPPNRVYISFSAEINPNTTESLIATVANVVNQGKAEVYLMISTPGGSVMYGLNVYNVLRAFPVKLITLNVGNVDPIGGWPNLDGWDPRPRKIETMVPPRWELYGQPVSIMRIAGPNFSRCPAQRV
jgi:hypothetical protein